MSRQPIELRRGWHQPRKKRKKEPKSAYTKGVGISKLQSNGMPNELCGGSGVAVILLSTVSIFVHIAHDRCVYCT